MNILSRLKALIDELAETSSSLQKIEILKKYPELQPILYHTYFELWQYGVTSANIVKVGIAAKEAKYKDIFSLLTALRTREITGHEAIGEVNAFIVENGFGREVFRIIDKDLKVGINTSLINKAFPNAIPTFDVALAKVYQENEKKVSFEKDKWYASRKLDGCRLITIIEKGNIRFYSRKGKEFFTLDTLKKNLLECLPSLKDESFVLDGELCMIDANGNESFHDIIKQVKQKDHTIPNPFYMIFDLIAAEDFIEGEGKLTYSKRQEELKHLIDNAVKSPTNFKRVEQTLILNSLNFETMREQARSNGWEGLIIRKDVPYEGKRSANLLKVKDFQDGEFKVLDYEVGDFRVIEDGKEATLRTLTAVIIDYKGYKVNVGSGFTIDERKLFFANPELIVGKTINVRYFKESKNENGGISLQFPTFKYLYGEEREE